MFQKMAYARGDNYSVPDRPWQSYHQQNNYHRHYWQEADQYRNRDLWLVVNCDDATDQAVISRRQQG